MKLVRGGNLVFRGVMDVGLAGQYTDWSHLAFSIAFLVIAQYILRRTQWSRVEPERGYLLCIR